MDNDVTRISTFRDGTISINAIKSKNCTFYTMNFKATVAILAISAGIDISTHTNMVTDFEAANTWTHLFHNSNNLMPSMHMKRLWKHEFEEVGKKKKKKKE